MWYQTLTPQELWYKWFQTKSQHYKEEVIQVPYKCKLNGQHLSMATHPSLLTSFTSLTPKANGKPLPAQITLVITWAPSSHTLQV
jgi:hypothetical protein